jgi:RNA polymerase sigma-70 factor (ECF subfamily)
VIGSRDGSGVLAAPTCEMGVPAHALVMRQLSFEEVYAEHVGFVWRVVRTLGVADAHVEDAVQDVFVVVHRRLAQFEGRAAITTWLFAIARRIAAGYRRRNHGERSAPLDEQLAGTADTFTELWRAEAAARVLAMLARIDEDQRVVLALVELEQLPVPEVARMLDINLNTAYSRLRLARKAFERIRAKETP